MSVKATVKTVDACRRTLQIEVPVAVLVDRREEVFRQIGRQAQIPGFRVGKAPLELVKERYQRQAEEELVHAVVPDAVEAALAQHQLEPVARPRVTDVRYEPGKPMALAVEVEVKPELKAKGYRGLKLKRPTRTVTDGDLERALRALQEQQAELVPVDGRAAVDGDYLFCDIICTVGNATVEQAQKQWLRASESVPSESEALWSGVIKQLIGAQAGQTVEHPVTLPANYRQAKWAGQSALLRVKVHEIKSKRLPAIDDELAKAMGRWQTLEELKGAIREELAARWVSESSEAVRHDALLALIKTMHVEVPPSLVESELDAMVADTLARAREQGASEAQLKEQEPVLRQRLQEPAADRVRLLFIIEAVARQEQLTLSEEEWQAKLVEIAGQTKRSADEVERWLEQQGLMSRLRWQMLERKVLDLVLREAQIEDVEQRPDAAASDAAGAAVVAASAVGQTGDAAR